MVNYILNWVFSPLSLTHLFGETHNLQSVALPDWSISASVHQLVYLFHCLNCCDLKWRKETKTRQKSEAWLQPGVITWISMAMTKFPNYCEISWDCFSCCFESAREEHQAGDTGRSKERSSYQDTIQHAKRYTVWRADHLFSQLVWF